MHPELGLGFDHVELSQMRITVDCRELLPGDYAMSPAGTKVYASPEIWNGNSYNNKVRSFGLTFQSKLLIILVMNFRSSDLACLFVGFSFVRL